MGFLTNVLNDYEESLRNDFLKLKDLKEAVAILEDRGFTTSRIYGYKNVKRLTAYNQDKNRLEFIFSTKNRYIVYSYGFSSAKKNTIKVISNYRKNENDILFTQNKERNQTFSYELDRLCNSYKEKDYSFEINPLEIFLRKNERYSQTPKVKSVAGLNTISNIRNELINKEIDTTKLKSLSDISQKKKVEMLKRISKKVGRFYFNDDWTYNELPKSKFHYEFFIGMFIYEEIMFKYSFTEKEVKDLVFKYLQEYMLLNIESIVKEKNDKLLEKELKELEIYHKRRGDDFIAIERKKDERELTLRIEKSSNKLIENFKKYFFFYLSSKPATEEEVRNNQNRYSNNTDDIPF